MIWLLRMLWHRIRFHKVRAYELSPVIVCETCRKLGEAWLRREAAQPPSEGKKGFPSLRLPTVRY